MQATTAFFLILFVTVGACSSKAYLPEENKKPLKITTDLVTEENLTDKIKTEENKNEGTTAVESVIQKNGNIYISDCYLSTMKPGEIKTKMIGDRDTKFDDEKPVNQIYVWDSNSATERPPQSVFIKNIDYYSVTIQNGHSCGSCSNNNKCLTKIIKVIETKANDVFKKVEPRNVPSYTIMGENWNFYFTDCYLDNYNFASGSVSIENIYIRDDDSATECVPKQMTITNSKRYNITIRSLDDYDHCVIADAPCWPKEKRFIDIKFN